jgi:hypothetical protein
MVCPAIDNYASCEIHIVICFLYAKTLSDVEIYHELCTVYEGTVRQWCIMFIDVRTDVHDRERSGWPSVVSDDLVQIVNQKISFSELSCEFP